MVARPEEDAPGGLQESSGYLVLPRRWAKGLGMFTACRVYGVSRVCSVYKLCRVHIVDGGYRAYTVHRVHRVCIIYCYIRFIV